MELSAILKCFPRSDPICTILDAKLPISSHFPDRLQISSTVPVSSGEVAQSQSQCRGLIKSRFTLNRTGIRTSHFLRSMVSTTGELLDRIQRHAEITSMK